MFDKEIWKLFKLKRDDFNKADREIERILTKIYLKGKADGRKERNKELQSIFEKELKKG